MPSGISTRLERLAEILVEYSVSAGPGDLVVLTAPVTAAPLVRELYRRIVAAGAHARTEIGLDETTDSLMAEGSEAQLSWVNPVRLAEAEQADAQIFVRAESNTRSLSGVPPERLAAASRATEEIRRRMLARAAAGELRWVVTDLPTDAAAQEAEMSLAEYEDFVYSAGFLDGEDPVERWRSFAGELDAAASVLAGARELRVVADGTDLVLGVEGRTWVPSVGRENFPDGEVFTAPVETAVDGTIRFTYPAIFKRREVIDVQLRFERGEVVEARAARGEEFLREMLALDDGARRAGEFAFGLNYEIDRFTRNTLFDEKIGGTVHLALGESYPESGGVNHSALHWDMICDLRDGGEVYADGELVHRDGRFLDGA